jgi:hypothetical protein
VPEVRLERTLRVPADLAYEALGKTLHAIADQEGPWRGFALHVSFGDLHLPDVGYIAVPIRLSVTKNADASRSFAVAFTASNVPAAFPGFKGTMGLDPGALGECTLYLRGIFELPMQLFGKVFDAALTPGVANRSLENFVDEMGAACEARVNQRETEFARYHFYAKNFQ